MTLSAVAISVYLLSLFAYFAYIFTIMRSVYIPVSL